MCALATQTLKRKESFVKRASQGEPARTHAVVADEAEFVRLLVLERKRSERSGRPFLLALLEGEADLFESSDETSIRARVMGALVGCTRETDVVGWYKQGSALGVILTELTEPYSDALQAIKSKIQDSIQNQVPSTKLKRIHISFHLFPDNGSSEGETTDLVLYPDLAARAESKKIVRGVKRFVDISLSLAAITLLMPVLVTIALAVKLTSKGPILFRQTRVGQYAEGFTFLKFRSMHVNCDEGIHKAYVSSFIAGGQSCGNEGSGSKVFKLVADPRVTRVGRFLRKTSLDELPQFFNVLRGDMSLVGPRPPLPYEVDQYDPWHKRRILEAKPGITGLWQVSGRSRTTFDEMVRLDLQYVQQHSLILDLRILLQTPAAVFTGHGAY